MSRPTRGPYPPQEEISLVNWVGKGCGPVRLEKWRAWPYDQAAMPAFTLSLGFAIRPLIMSAIRDEGIRA